MESNRREEGNHPLVVLVGVLIEFLNRHFLYGRSRALQTLKQFSADGTAHITADEYLIYFFARINGFYHGTNAKNHLFLRRATSFVTHNNFKLKDPLNLP